MVPLVSPELDSYLIEVLPERDPVTSEMEAYARVNDVPIVGPDTEDPAPESDAPPTPAGPPCRHLRSKGMYVYTDGLSDSESDSSAYWCLATMTGFGPDDESVGRPACCDPSRSCYEAL